MLEGGEYAADQVRPGETRWEEGEQLFWPQANGPHPPPIHQLVFSRVQKHLVSRHSYGHSHGHNYGHRHKRDLELPQQWYLR